MPAVARSRMLTFCDDMPSKTALVATTNLSADAMRKANPATQRRYTWIELDPPTDPVKTSGAGMIYADYSEALIRL